MSQLDQSQTSVPPHVKPDNGFGNSSQVSVGQSFQPTTTAQLHSIEVALSKYNLTTSTSVRMKIYSNSSSVPDSLLATSSNNIASSAIGDRYSGNGYTLHTFNFTNGPSLTANTTYWFVLETLDVLNNDEYIYTNGYFDTTDPYTRGVPKYYDGVSWTLVQGDTFQDYDLYFQQYYAESSESASPSITPSASVSLSPSPSVSPSSSPSSSPSEGSSVSLSPSSSPSITPSASISLSISLSPSRSYSASVSPSSSDSVSMSPSPSPAFECDQTQLIASGMNTPGITNANSGLWAYGQSFVPSSEYPVGKVQVKVKRSGDISGTLRLLIMSSLNGSPLSIIDTSNNTYDISTLEVDVDTALDFHFNHDVFLVPGRTYFIVLDGVDIVAPFAGAVNILGSDAYSAELDAYTSGKLMYTEAFDGINDTWVNAAGNDEGTAWWADMYFKVCFDPLAWSTSPSISVSLSPSASVSPSLTPSASISPSFSPSASVSVSPSRSQYEDKYAIKSTVYTDKYKKW